MGLLQGERRRARLTRIYKILTREAWDEALAQGEYRGSALDLTDGFIHFSTAGQAQETARRHFTGQAGLVVLSVDAEALGDALRWEPSRGGDLFPHLYAPLSCNLVLGVRAARLGRDGAPVLGALTP